uniref:Ig-like domain-containing protein n=1 Tax=Podarcis muralis TaxID=64176 RepID=A0A670K1Q4_PODMU
STRGETAERLGVTSQSAWTQPASESVTLGQTVKLSCTTDDGRWYIYWYQQRSGDNSGEGILDRFTASRSGSIGYLTITNAEAEDEADYYCGRWNTDANKFHGGTFLWGTETKTLPLLPQSWQELGQSNGSSPFHGDLNSQPSDQQAQEAQWFNPQSHPCLLYLQV